MPLPTFTRPERSLAFARERDDYLCWLLEQHPVTAGMLVGLRLFPNRRKAVRRLRRLVQRRRIRCVGTVCRKPGRPENVYCRWTPRSNHLLHEIEITEFCFRLHAEKILRGPNVVALQLRPDAEIRINGDVLYLEWDRGTMSYGQIVRDRFPPYERCPFLVLWVCQSDLRREGLRNRAERIRDVALFTTAREALASPHGQIWLDHQGSKAAVPRQRTEAGTSRSL